MLTTPEQLHVAEAAFGRVFAKASSTEPFDCGIAARLLLYPIDYTVLDRIQFHAVAAASVQLGATTAYLAGFGGEKVGWGGTYGHRLVDLNDYDDYRAVHGAINLEHFLFAPTGEWGIVTSDGQYALVGGGSAFIAAVRDRLGYDENRAVRAFVADWREAGQAGASVSWVPTLLDHMLGKDEGARRWNE